MTEEDATTKNELTKEVLLSWKSPSRTFKKRTKEFYTNIGAIVFLLAVILIFASEFMLVVAVLSIVFFVYITSTVPPEEVDHKITNLGIETAGSYYRWDDMIDFWFEEQWGQQKAVVRPILGTQIIMLIPNTLQPKLHELMAKFIPFREEPQKSWVDNAATWLSEKVPLEKPAS